jgi:hypothetical protein
LSPASDFFFDEARRCGRHDTHEAYLADALVAAVTGEWPGGAGGGDSDEPEGAEDEDEDAGEGGRGEDGHDAGALGQALCAGDSSPAGPRGLGPAALCAGDSSPAGAPGPGSAAGSADGRPQVRGSDGQAGGRASRASSGKRRRGNPDTGPPRATVICRVELAALLRGSLEPGERCEIPGVGPVPLSVARELFGDCFLKFVIADGIDVRTVVHYGRAIPAHLKTALQFRDRCCVVPGCGRTFGLEYDHIVEFAKGGPTTLDNLCRLCRPHHALKTHRAYRIRGGPGHWEWEGPGQARGRGGSEEGRAPARPQAGEQNARSEAMVTRDEETLF